jgi:outer membrane protein TolC
MKSSVLLSMLFLVGCNLVQDFQAPVTDLPEHWREQTAPSSEVDPQWWKAFGSLELNRLIATALAYNNDLAAAAQRVEQARAQAKIAGAELWPAVGLSGDFNNTQNKLGDTQKESGQFSVA